MRTSKTWAAVVGLLALTVTAPSLADVAQSTLLVTASVFSNASQPPLPEDRHVDTYDGGTCPGSGPPPCVNPFLQVSAALRDSGTRGDGSTYGFEGSAGASASFMALRAGSAFGATGMNAGFSTVAAAGSQAESTDRLFFAAPGVAIAEVELHIRYTGTVAGDAGATLVLAFGGASQNVFASFEGSYDEDVVLRTPFDDLGIPLLQRLITRAQVPARVVDWNGAGQADFSHTVRVSALYAYDADGRQIGTYTVQSASGTDYLGALAAVPEPGSWALMLGGAALLALHGRRRSK